MMCGAELLLVRISSLRGRELVPLRHSSRMVARSYHAAGFVCHTSVNEVLHKCFLDKLNSMESEFVACDGHLTIARLTLEADLDAERQARIHPHPRTRHGIQIRHSSSKSVFLGCLIRFDSENTWSTELRSSLTRSRSRWKHSQSACGIYLLPLAA